MTPALILVVDDDEAMRHTLFDLLEEEGYRVAMVSNGREAIEYFERGETADLILLDLMMPEMDGWEFISCKSRMPEMTGIPVVVHSVFDEPDDKVCGYVQKPSNLNRLFDSLAKCLREHGKPGPKED